MSAAVAVPVLSIVIVVMLAPSPRVEKLNRTNCVPLFVPFVLMNIKLGAEFAPVIVRLPRVALMLVDVVTSVSVKS